MSNIPSDYDERVYAGVLGKIIGVYLGRPFEGWTYDRIQRELGEVTYYVNERIAHHPPLIVTDDDISGTFTFLRALPDYGNSPDLTAAQIGQTWLNYLIERQTILWWGGMGNSTEHTAYVRLKQGHVAPRSGSIELNSKVVAEQIGAQIFIDGWAMVAPGNPGLAADLARKAASVSHDGEAIYGAQVLAAMEAQAFIEPDMNKLFDVGVSFAPKGSLIAQLIGDIRAWRTLDNDWRKTRARIEEKYGYDKYGGNCHMIPNHAVIILALAYCEDDPALTPGQAFQRALMIGNTAGWDTDCNSGNIGCLMGIKNGLTAIDSSPVDWRGPVADRLYLPTADGGRCITDAVQMARRIARIGRELAGQVANLPATMGQVADLPTAMGQIVNLPTALGQVTALPTAMGQVTNLPYGTRERYKFEFPGSVQGFRSLNGNSSVVNAEGHSTKGARSLAISLAPKEGTESGKGVDIKVSTATFIPPEALKMEHYDLIACPTLYPGQLITAGVSSDVDVNVNLFARAYGADNELMHKSGLSEELHAGESKVLSWLPIGIDGGSPIAEVGLQVTRSTAVEGNVYLDYLTWAGAPSVALSRPNHNGTMWQRAWVKACDDLGFNGSGAMAIRISQDTGTGLLIQGESEWSNYTARATIIPHMARSAGIAVCVQGLRRYYALLVCSDQKARLVKEYSREPGASPEQRILAETGFAWQLDGEYELALATRDNHLIATANGQQLFDVQDTEFPLLGGAIALVIEEGRLDCNGVTIKA